MTTTPEERKQKILDILKDKGTVRVTTLSRLFGVSEVTVRTYLEDMEKKGLLARVHGGAVSTYKPYYSMSLNQRLDTHQRAKLAIAERVTSLIQPNDTIMLNSGTTTLLVFRRFPREYHLNIVTNSISIALEASDNPNYHVILVGGSVNTRYQFTYGTDAEEQIRKYHADKFILSVDGIDPKQGFTSYYNEEASIDRAMAEQSDCCIVAADRSKFGHSAFAKISGFSVADYIVTNEPVNGELEESLEACGVSVLFSDNAAITK